jgi:hypothetical protein
VEGSTAHSKSNNFFTSDIYMLKRESHQLHDCAGMNIHYSKIHDLVQMSPNISYSTTEYPNLNKPLLSVICDGQLCNLLALTYMTIA